MTIKKFREFLSEDWLVVDKEKNCVISKHGDDEKAATIAGRKMDFINYNKTKKLGQLAIRAAPVEKIWSWISPTSSPKAGDRKRKVPPFGSKKAKPGREEGSREESYRREKASGQSSSESKGRLGTQIGGLIAKHMAKMFKEETDINEIGSYFTYDKFASC